MIRQTLLLILVIVSFSVATAQNDFDRLLSVSCGQQLSSSQADDLRLAYEKYNNRRYTECVKLARGVMKQAPQSPHPYFRSH